MILCFQKRDRGDATFESAEFANGICSFLGRWAKTLFLCC